MRNYTRSAPRKLLLPLKIRHSQTLGSRHPATKPRKMHTPKATSQRDTRTPQPPSYKRTTKYTSILPNDTEPCNESALKLISVSCRRHRWPSSWWLQPPTPTCSPYYLLNYRTLGVEILSRIAVGVHKTGVCTRGLQGSNDVCVHLRSWLLVVGGAPVSEPTLKSWEDVCCGTYCCARTTFEN